MWNEVHLLLIAYSHSSSVIVLKTYKPIHNQSLFRHRLDNQNMKLPSKKITILNIIWHRRASAAELAFAVQIVAN